MTADLALNLTLLVALSVLSGFVGQRAPVGTRAGAVLQGLLFGGATIACITYALTPAPGLLVDGRTVAMSLCGLFFGWWAAVPGFLLATAYRVWLGGPNAELGIVLMASAALAGALVHARRGPGAPPLSTPALYLFSVAVHLCASPILWLLPPDLARLAFVQMAPLVLLLFPAATILAGRILADQQSTATTLETLRRTKQDLDTTLQSIGEAVVSTDLGLRIVHMNPAAESLTGWRHDEARGTRLDHVVRLAAGAPGVAAPLDAVAVLRGGVPVALPEPCVLLARDGAQRSVAGTAAPMKDGRGTIAGLVLAFDDRTAQEAERRALAESEERLRLALAAGNQGWFDLHVPSGACVVSPEYAGMLGHDPATFTETTAGWRARMHPDDLDAAERAFDDYVSGRVPAYRAEFRQRCRDGSWKWILGMGRLVSRLPDRRPLRMLGTHTDITARRSAEAELRLQSAALNAAASAVVITERDGTIVWVNPAFTELTGYAAHDVLGRTLRVLKSGVHDARFYAEMWETLTAGRVWRGEVTNRRKDGTLYVEDQTVTPVRDGRGDITHFISIKRDLTVQRQLEAQVLQAQKMESVGRLAGGIAHDFNNLLTVINGTADLLLDQMPAGDSLRADVAHVKRAGERAASLTRQLLAFSRKQLVQPVIVDLRMLVTEMEDMLHRLLGEHIDLVLFSPPSVGHVKADPGQLVQVVMNLAVNARDAMPEGGRLTIELDDVELDEGYAQAHAAVTPGSYVQLVVTDTGLGMDAETRARIFDPFFTTKDVGDGTGLGLATVYGIVKQSGGTIWVYSEVGRGTTFKVFLPRVEEPAPQRVVPVAPTPSAGSGTILLVEDESALRQLATRILTSAGYTVLAAGHGDEALDVLDRHVGDVDLLLTDMVLPGMSGRELAVRVLERRPDTRVLYTSGYTDDTVLRHGLAKNVASFIGKPYSVGQLTRKVHEVMQLPADAGGIGTLN